MRRQSPRGRPSSNSSSSSPSSTIPSGAFGQFQALWTGQHNARDDAGLAGDHFWQFDALAGYRFAQRRAEITLGLLNLTARTTI